MDFPVHDSYLGLIDAFCREILSMRNTLRELSSKDRISQAEMAKILNVSRQTINSIEKGKYDPSLPLAFRIAGYFGLKIEDIFVPD